MNVAKIGIIGAMQEEIEQLVQHMTNTTESMLAGIRYFEGVIEGKRAVVCKSGVGKVNAAVCTQILIDRFQVEAVIFTGVAGALDPELTIGDIVVSNDCMQHDMDVTALGFSKGIIPFAEQSMFVADAALADAAIRVSARLFGGRAKLGRVLSGDQFIASREKVSELHQELGGTCTEMEGAAVAQVCAMNNTPFVVIRSMSDKADGSAHVNFAEFTVLASQHSFQIVQGMLREI
jgi:adenosylhomocysteine nucleosidase